MLEGDWREVKVVKVKRSNVKKSKWAAAPNATRRLPVPVRVLISRRRQHKRKGRLPAEVNTSRYRYSPSRPVHEKLSMVWASGRHMGKGGVHVPILPL